MKGREFRSEDAIPGGLHAYNLEHDGLSAFYRVSKPNIIEFCWKVRTGRVNIKKVKVDALTDFYRDEENGSPYFLTEYHKRLGRINTKAQRTA